MSSRIGIIAYVDGAFGILNNRIIMYIADDVDDASAYSVFNV
jgi:hypothetical protein